MGEEKKEIMSCLRNEKVIVRRLPKRTNLVKDSNHIMGDGMHNNAFRTFCVPKYERRNAFVNVLTNEEMEYLEQAMGLQKGALSIYRQPAEENYWSTANPNGLGSVTLRKGDNIFDLSNPSEYIAVKILLANKDKICPSMAEWEARPKETYEYVLIREGQDNKALENNADVTIEAIMKLGKVAEDKEVLKLIVETMVGKKYADHTSKEWLKNQAVDMIKSASKNARLFLSIVNDDFLDNKVLIRRALSKGLVADRGGYLYIKDGNVPMCGDGEDPTMQVAAKWLAKPQNQERLFSLQAKIKGETKEEK